MRNWEPRMVEDRSIGIGKAECGIVEGRGQTTEDRRQRTGDRRLEVEKIRR
jgi:hypothetical protein